MRVRFNAAKNREVKRKPGVSLEEARFTVVRPVRRVNVGLTQGMLRELGERAARLNVSRQAVIKTLLRQALDQNSPRTPSKRRAG